MTTLSKDLLNIEVFGTREEMGKEAAKEAAEYICELLKRKDEINMIFAAAPSQNDFLKFLVQHKEIDWSRINGYHMDEYVGLDKDQPQSFGYYLEKHIFGLVPFKSVHYIAKKGLSADEICRSYCDELRKIHIDIVCMGVGENGHIAFNDPHVADFNDPEIAKVVELDEVCRMQQVHDGCFPSLDKVPTHAITLTIPTLVSADRIFNIVPTALKANAIKNIVKGEITEACPASILRRHKATTLYLDADSSKYITT